MITAHLLGVTEHTDTNGLTTHNHLASRLKSSSTHSHLAFGETPPLSLEILIKARMVGVEPIGEGALGSVKTLYDDSGFLGYGDLCLGSRTTACWRKCWLLFPLFLPLTALTGLSFAWTTGIHVTLCLGLPFHVIS